MQKKIHYSRTGYNGNYTYTAVCRKIVKTHQDNEDTSVHSEEANCKQCLKTTEYKIDLEDSKLLPGPILRRIYLESDILQANEFHRAQREAESYAQERKLPVVDRIFSKVFDHAWHHLDEVWDAIKKCEEIYATSSLMPLVGGSYMGAPVIFNGMCERAVKENITGKSVIIFNTLENIEWYMIDVKIMKQAFKGNSLLMYDDDHNKIVKVNVSKIKGK